MFNAKWIIDHESFTFFLKALKKFVDGNPLFLHFTCRINFFLIYLFDYMQLLCRKQGVKKGLTMNEIWMVIYNRDWYIKDIRWNLNYWSSLKFKTKNDVSKITYKTVKFEYLNFRFFMHMNVHNVHHLMIDRMMFQFYELS